MLGYTTYCVNAVGISSLYHFLCHSDDFQQQILINVHASNFLNVLFLSVSHSHSFFWYWTKKNIYTQKIAKFQIATLISNTETVEIILLLLLLLLFRFVFVHISNTQHDIHPSESPTIRQTLRRLFSSNTKKEKHTQIEMCMCESVFSLLLEKLWLYYG